MFFIYLWGFFASLEEVLKIKKARINLCRSLVFKTNNINFCGCWTTSQRFIHLNLLKKLQRKVTSKEPSHPLDVLKGIQAQQKETNLSQTVQNSTVVLGPENLQNIKQIIFQLHMFQIYIPTILQLNLPVYKYMMLPNILYTKICFQILKLDNITWANDASKYIRKINMSSKILNCHITLANHCIDKRAWKTNRKPRNQWERHSMLDVCSIEQIFTTKTNLNATFESLEK